MWWSVVLAVIGVFGLYLTTRKMAAGYAVGVAVQVLWIAYAIVTAQYGFIFSALAFGAVNALGFYRWTKEAVEKPDLGERLKAPNDDLKVTYFEPKVPRVAINRMAPHEWTDKGDALWNIYPFVRTLGDKIILGPDGQQKYTLDVHQAYHAGRALIESSGLAEPIKKDIS